jgi:hypothetical protein
MVILQAVEKKATESRTRMHAIALLLEEQTSVAILEAEATAAAVQLVLTTTSSNALPSPSSGACGVQNIRSIISTILDPSSTGYAQ